MNDIVTQTLMGLVLLLMGIALLGALVIMILNPWFFVTILVILCTSFLIGKLTYRRCRNGYQDLNRTQVRQECR